MISKDARSIILELVDIDLDRLYTGFDKNNDNDLINFVVDRYGDLNSFEYQYGVEFYD